MNFSIMNTAKGGLSRDGLNGSDVEVPMESAFLNRDTKKSVPFPDVRGVDSLWQ
jgi:hypothetical protein